MGRVAVGVLCTWKVENAPTGRTGVTRHRAVNPN